MNSLREQIAQAMFEKNLPADARRWDDRWRVYADAALVAIEASGFAVVPVEPTEAMLDAGMMHDPGRASTSILGHGHESAATPWTMEDGEGFPAFNALNLYRAMIAARPRDVSPTEESDAR